MCQFIMMCWLKWFDYFSRKFSTKISGVISISSIAISILRFLPRTIIKMKLSFLALLNSGFLVVAVPVKDLLEEATLHVTTHSSRGMSQHHNAGFVNTTGQPFELEYADKEKSVIEAFGENYTFSDLFTIDDYKHINDTTNVTDIDFFEFNEANLEESQQTSFYALWSMSAQDHPEFNQRGEWALFASEFMNTKNFQCSFDNGKCHNMPSLLEIRQLYPDNRPFARIIFFTGIKMELLHNLNKAVEVSTLSYVSRMLTDRSTGRNE